MTFNFQEGDTSNGGIGYTTDAVTIREWTGTNFDGDANQNTSSQLIIGFNEPAPLPPDQFTTRELLRGLLEFDLSAIETALGGSPFSIDNVNLVLHTTNTEPGKQELSGFDQDFQVDVYNYGFDLVEAAATWVSPASGDATAGGTLGTFLSSTPTFDPRTQNVDRTAPDSAAFRTAVSDALAGDNILRLLIRAPDGVENAAQSTGPAFDAAFVRFDAEDSSVLFGNRPVLTVQFSAVPEPSTLALMSLGAAGLLGYGWRRRKRKDAA